MELFHVQEGAHLRLRSRYHNAYLYASEDGLRVGLSPRRASLNAAWAVHRLVHDDLSFVLLRSAAYGRYLGVMYVVPGRLGRLVQLAHSSPVQADIMWQAREVESDESGDFYMGHERHGIWRNIEEPGRPWMRWIVEAIPPREDPPQLPPAIPPPEVTVTGGPIRNRNQRRHRAALPPVFRRRIQYVRANHQGHINPMDWRMLWFDGRSVFHLRTDLAAELGEANFLNITLCVRAGSLGRPTPLVIDLPAEEQNMEIIVFTTESQAAEELVYPNVDA